MRYWIRTSKNGEIEPNDEALAFGAEIRRDPEKVEAQLKRQISATTARSGSGRFKHPGLYPARNRTQSGLEPVRLLRVFCIHKSVKN
ncbi:MAG: hypothetical protein ACLSAM_04745 [Alistipes onderdonkii]